MRTHNPRNLEHLLADPVTKGDVFADFPHMFDYAMPQEWLDAFADWCQTHRAAVTYDLIRSTTVWSYPEHDLCGPVTCCVEVMQAWDKYVKDTE